MKTHISHIYRQRRKRKINYSNYHFALALYDVIKNESRKSARLPVQYSGNAFIQKQPGIVTLKQKLMGYVQVIRKAITDNFFHGKKKLEIIDQHVA